MTVTIHQTPSGSYLFKGLLTQKKLTAKSKRHVVLCLPTSPDDIKFIHDQLTLSSALKNSPNLTSEQSLEILSQGDTTIYGHLALSAISGFPVLILGSTVRTFIHFSQIQGMFDESDLEAACTFAILTAHREYRFSAETSVDYQKWIGALSQAFEKMTVLNNDYRPPSDAYMTTLERNTTSAGNMSSGSHPLPPVPSEPSGAYHYSNNPNPGLQIQPRTSSYPTPTGTPSSNGMPGRGSLPRYRSRSRARSSTRASISEDPQSTGNVAWNATLSKEVENITSDDSSERKRANLLDRVVSFFRRDLTLDEIVEQRRSRSKSRARSLSRLRSLSRGTSSNGRRRFSIAALVGNRDDDYDEDEEYEDTRGGRGRRSRSRGTSFSRWRSRSRSVSRFLSTLLTVRKNNEERIY